MIEFLQQYQDQLMVAGFIIVPTYLIEISPLKINPWTWIGDLIKKLLQSLGRSLNAEVMAELKEVRADYKELKDDLTQHIEVSGERDIKQCRMRILRFNDEVIRKTKHTKEHWDNILEDIDSYDKYCDDHPKYENNKAVMAIANIKRAYLECAEHDGFL